MISDYLKYVLLAATNPKEAMAKLEGEPRHVRRLMMASVGLVGAAVMFIFALVMGQFVTDPDLGTVFVAMKAVFNIGAIILLCFGVFTAYLAARDGKQ